MKRRAVIEAVCRLRKLRDMMRKLEKEGANNIKFMQVEAIMGRMQSKCEAFYDGMCSIVQDRAIEAAAFHRSAHICWAILETA